MRFDPLARSTLTLAILALGWLSSSPAAAEYEQATLTDFADIYAGPGEDFYVVEDGEEGISYPVLERKGEWIKVKLESGTGWLHSSRVELSTVEGELAGDEESSPAEDEPAEEEGGAGVQAVVKGKLIKMYAKPDTNSVVVKKLRKGTQVEVVQRSDDKRWYKVRHDGPMAWVRAKDVRLVGLEAGGPAPSIPSESEHFRVMGERELAQASDDLGSGQLRLWVGVGMARLRQSFAAADESGRYKYTNYRPPSDYDISTPGPALDLGADYWFTPNLGLELGGGFVVAKQGITVNNRAFAKDEIKLSAANYAFDLAGTWRWPFLREGAYFYARLGYRYFQFDVDQAMPAPSEIGGATSPLFWAMVYQGPLLGLGVRFPLGDWGGVRFKADGVPYAIARNALQGGSADTPTGNVDSAFGFAVQAGLWFVVARAPIQVEAEVRAFYSYFKSNFSVPDGADVPRAQAPYLSYSEAASDEQTGGGVAALVLRF